MLGCQAIVRPDAYLKVLGMVVRGTLRVTTSSARALRYAAERRRRVGPAPVVEGDEPAVRDVVESALLLRATALHSVRSIEHRVAWRKNRPDVVLDVQAAARPLVAGLQSLPVGVEAALLRAGVECRSLAALANREPLDGTYDALLALREDRFELIRRIDEMLRAVTEPLATDPFRSTTRR